MTKLRTAAAGLGYLPSKAIGLIVSLLLTSSPKAQQNLKASRGTQMRVCARVTPRRASKSVPEERIFKGKVRETEEKRRQLLQPPASKGSCTLSAAPNGAHFHFFWVETKNNGVYRWCPRASCPQRAATVGRGCHRPPGLPKRFLAQEGGQSESCPGATKPARLVSW